MSRYHNPQLSQKVARNVGKVASVAIEIKETLTHPEEAAIKHVSKKLINYSRKNTGLKGPYRNRVQVYNKGTNRFVKIDTRSNKILGSSKKPYKRIRRK